MTRVLAVGAVLGLAGVLVALTLKTPSVPTYAPTTVAARDVGARLVGPILYTVDASAPDIWRYFSFRLGPGPELLHHEDRFAGLRPAVIEVAAHDRRLLAMPARADAEEEPAAAEEIERRDLLREQERVALRHERDAGAELHLRRHTRRASQSDERVDEMRVRLGDDAVGRAREAARAVDRHDRVLGAPQRLEAQALGDPRDERWIDAVRGKRDGDADVHGRPPS
jgi:hypothetical protein